MEFLLASLEIREFATFVYIIFGRKKLVKMKCTFSSNFSLQKNAKKSHLRQFVSLKMSKIGFRRFQTIRLDRFPRYLLLPLAVAGLWKSQSLNSNIAKMAENRDLKVLGGFSPICCLKNLKKNHLHIWSHMATIGQSLELKIWPWFFGRFFWCENFPTFELLCTWWLPNYQLSAVLTENSWKISAGFTAR